ncbi:MAG: hypothetical protein ABI741_14750 [Ferruginibacter sp.]
MFNNIKPVLAGLLCLAFASCKKDMADENPVTPENNAVSTAASSKANDSYYPYDNGSSYTYVDSTLGGASTVNRSAISIAGDTTIDGKTFIKTNSNYFNSTDGVTTLVAFNGTDKITTTVLKANEPVGTVWKDVFSNAGVPTTYEWKIVAKGMNRTVQGIAYSNVIQVHLSGYADVPGKGKVLMANSDYYYAPNVGLIENISYNTASGKTELHRELKNTVAP